MTLTEQWKKGELKAGMYYIKYKGSGKLDWWHGYYWEDSWSENVEEVLTPVPSYEEWQQLKEDNRIFEEKIHNSYKEIGQLKKLLKDYREVIYMAKGHPDAFIHMEFLNDILFKINEVLK